MFRLNNGLWAVAAAVYVAVMAVMLWQFLPLYQRQAVTSRFKRWRWLSRWHSWPTWLREAYIVRHGSPE